MLNCFIQKLYYIKIRKNMCAFLRVNRPLQANWGHSWGTHYTISDLHLLLVNCAAKKMSLFCNSQEWNINNNVIKLSRP